MPDGSLKTSPSGEDFGEILLNTVMGGSYMMGKGFGQLWKSPELMLQSGIDRLPNIPTLKQIQAQQAKDGSVFTQDPVLRRAYDTPAATNWRGAINDIRHQWGH